MRFKLLNFARKLCLMLFTKCFCLFYIISTQTTFIYKKFHDMNGFVFQNCLLFSDIPCILFMVNPQKCAHTQRTVLKHYQLS
jgi:uncharacterized membrane protein